MQTGTASNAHSPPITFHHNQIKIQSLYMSNYVQVTYSRPPSPLHYSHCGLPGPRTHQASLAPGPSDFCLAEMAFFHIPTWPVSWFHLDLLSNSPLQRKTFPDYLILYSHLSFLHLPWLLFIPFLHCTYVTWTIYVFILTGTSYVLSLKAL